jgi:hypothetical protein
MATAVLPHMIFEVRHPRCVGSIKNFCLLYSRTQLSPSSTVGIQLYVLALYVGQLQVVI